MTLSSVTNGLADSSATITARRLARLTWQGRASIAPTSFGGVGAWNVRSNSVFFTQPRSRQRRCCCFSGNQRRWIFLPYGIVRLHAKQFGDMPAGGSAQYAKGFRTAIPLRGMRLQPADAETGILQRGGVMRL